MSHAGSQLVFRPVVISPTGGTTGDYSNVRAFHNYCWIFHSFWTRPVSHSTLEILWQHPRLMSNSWFHNAHINMHTSTHIWRSRQGLERGCGGKYTLHTDTLIIIARMAVSQLVIGLDCDRNMGYILTWRKYYSVSDEGAQVSSRPPNVLTGPPDPSASSQSDWKKTVSLL